MTNRFVFGIGVLVALASVAIVQLAIRPAVAYKQAQDNPICTMPQGQKYSPGALERHNGEIYRCLYVFGENLKPAGAAWIKMVKQGDMLVPKEPSTGR